MSRTFDRIVVGVDGSANSLAAVEVAVALAEAMGAAVVAVHAVGLLERFREQHEDDGAQRVPSDWVGPLTGSDLDVDVRAVDGPPVGVLLAAADRPGDLLVVGSRGAGGVPGLTLGSTSAQLVEQVTGKVRWRESVDWMHGQGVTRFVEAGAKVLVTMLKRHIREAEGVALTDQASLDAFAASLKG